MTAHRHHTFVLPMLTAITLIVTGCTTPLPGLPAPVPGGPATIYPPGAKVPDLSGRPEAFTPAQRVAISQAVTDAWKPRQTGDPAADAQSLLDTVAKTPGFADAGLGGDGSVWARYADGRPTTWILTDNDRAEPTPTPTEPASLAAPPPASLAASLPTLPDAALFEFTSIFNSDSITPVSAMLTAARYKPRIVADHVSQLQTQIKNLGVLLASTHGGVGNNVHGVPQYLLLTDDSWIDNPADDANWELYKEGLLVPVTLLFQRATYWAVNTDFVKKYWTFTGNALIYIGACSLYATPEGHAFAEAMRDGSEGKSATILGWDELVASPYDTRTTKKFFARVLGDNSVDREEVPRRPFTYKQVYDWMAKNGETSLGPFSATLTITYGPEGDGQLRPSILRANLLRPGKDAKVEHPGEQYLEIAGSFGPDLGPQLRKVTLGGQQLTVYDNGWTPERIVARIPAGQSITTIGGDLVVTVRDHPSNAVPITHWTGSVSMKQSVPGSRGTAQLTLDCRLRISGDVHFFRQAPDSTPKVSFTAPIDFPDGCHWRLSGSVSGCTISGGGRVDTPIQSGNLITMGKRPLNTDNDGHYPIQAFVASPSSKKPLMGTIRCGGGGGKYPAVPFYTGSYQNGEPLTLPSSMFVTGAQLSCRMVQGEACTEKWTLTPGVGVPTKQTQA